MSIPFAGGIFLFLVSGVLLVAGVRKLLFHRWDVGQIKSAPLCNADEVAREAPGLAKMEGTIIAPAVTMRSPMSQTDCVFYRFHVQQLEVHTSRTTDSRGRSTGTQTNYTWVTLIDDCRCTTCGVEDGRGAIEVSLREADFALSVNVREQGDSIGDLPKRARRALRDYGQRSFHGKSIRCTEQIIEPGQEVLVLGKVRLVQTPHGVRPRFARGKQPLVITDGTEKELIRHIYGKMLGSIQYFVGSAITCLIAVVFIGVSFMMPNFGGMSSESLAQRLRSPKREVRLDALTWAWHETVNKDPDDPKRIDIANAVVELLRDPDVEVARKAAGQVANVAQPAHLEALVAALKKPDGEIRRKAMEAIGKIRTPAAVEKLLSYLAAQGEDAESAKRTIESMGAVCEQPVSNYLTQKTYGANLEAAGRAVDILGRVGTRNCIPVLQEMAKVPALKRKANSAAFFAKGRG